MKKRYSPLFLLLLIPQVCWGKGVYIAGTTQGDDSGVSCATAHDETWFSTQGNWGVDATDMTPGDTIYFCDDGGTIDGQLIVRASGTSNAWYYFAPAPGEAPLLSYSATQGFLFGTGGRGYYQIDGLNTMTFGGGAANGRMLYLFGQHDVEIKNVIFDSDVSGSAIDIYTSTYDSYNVTIHDNIFLSNGTMEALRIAQIGANSKKPYNITVVDNTGDYLNYFIFGTADADTGINALRVEGLTVSRNTVEHTARDFIGINGGIDGTSLPSVISYNHIDQCGDSDAAAVNCFQLHRLLNVDILYNYVGQTDTSECDGCAFIFDWSDAEATYYSEGANVVGNTAYNSNAACGGKGFSLYRVKNSTFKNNVSINATDANFKIAWESTGNVISNNTAINTAGGSCFKIAADTTDAGTWTNNICNGTAEGWELLTGGDAPTETYNLFYGITGHTGITPHVTDISVNPLFLTPTDPRLRQNSPAIRAGSDGSDIGAYQTHQVIEDDENIFCPGILGGN